MNTHPHKGLLQREDGNEEVVSDDKSLKFAISPDGSLDSCVRVTGEPFDTGPLEVVFDDSDVLKRLEDAMKILEFHGRSSEYQEETRPARNLNLRLGLRSGEVLQDRGKLARKTLRTLKAKKKGK